LFGNERREGAEHNPGGEAGVKVQKAGYQCLPVAAFQRIDQLLHDELPQRAVQNKNAANGTRAFGTGRVGGVAFSEEVGCNGCAML
jgi:hypothetical protein